jgi:hypothetical protein
MCPACLATATLVLTGATSLGGVTALVLKVLHARNGTANHKNETVNHKESPQ